MDVDKIQRINNLAVELEKQGLAECREDAVAQARKIFNVEDGPAINNKDMHEGSLQPRDENSSDDSQSTVQTRLTDEKIEKILERNTKFLVSTIKKFEDKMAILETELAGIKSRIHKVSQPQAAPKPAPSAPVPSSPSPEPAATNPPAEPANTGSTNPQGGDHPRSGGYNDSDVSIEKFFYMGNK